MNLRDKFALKFGEQNAEKIVAAALEHDIGRIIQHNDQSDFRWALLMVIGWQCVELYNEYHKIDITWKKFKKWI